MELLNLEGRVIDVKYANSNDVNYANSNMSIVIERKRKKPLQVSLPIQLHNKIELIPYQLALLEQQVHYTATKKYVPRTGLKTSELDYDFVEATFCKLEILTGILKGKCYSARF